MYHVGDFSSPPSSCVSDVTWATAVHAVHAVFLSTEPCSTAQFFPRCRWGLGYLEVAGPSSFNPPELPVAIPLSTGANLARILEMQRQIQKSRFGRGVEFTGGASGQASRFLGDRL